MFVSALLILALIAFSNAHNWVNSPSRSEFANTVNPALPSPTGLPHVRVIAGQRFQIEWVNGHDSMVYFVILAEKDHMKNMLSHSVKMMDEYFDSAPNNMKSPPSADWAKYHRKYDNDNLKNKDTDSANMFKRTIRPRDCPADTDDPSACNDPAGYIRRQNVFKGRFTGAPRNVVDPNKVVQCEYLDTHVKDDRRAMYTNDKYPWVIGMHRYKIVTGQPNRPDVAQFVLPAGTAAGRYVVQWIWRGYYDVIDVEVMPGSTPVALPYGKELPLPPSGEPAQYRRVDHCYFPEPTVIGGCFIIETDARACLDMCDDLNELQCSGVNVVPVINPDTVYEGFKDIVLTPPNAQPCRRSQYFRTNPTSEMRLCVPINGRPKTDTVDRYVVTDDPDDPVFYSTCYLRIANADVVAAGGMLAPPEREPVWYFRGKCLGCKDATLSTLDYAIPRWNLAEGSCANCDVDGVQLSDIPNNQKPRDWSKYSPNWKSEGNKICTGHNRNDMEPTYTCTDDTRCNIRVRVLRGDSVAEISQADCEAAVRRTARCSNTVVMRATDNENPAYCWCWANDDCCGTCTPRNSGGMRMFTLE